jgi:hypothetical protein
MTSTAKLLEPKKLSQEETLMAFAPEDGIITSSLMAINNNPKKLAQKLRACNKGNLHHTNSLRNMKHSTTMQHFLKRQKDAAKQKLRKNALSTVVEAGDVPDGNAPQDPAEVAPQAVRMMGRSLSRKNLTSSLKKKFELKSRSLTMSSLKQRQAQGGTCPFLAELRSWYDTRWQLEEGMEAADASMFTDKAILQRESIRLQRPVQQILHQLFMVIDDDKSGEIDADEYLVLSQKLYTAIRGFWDEDLPELARAEMNEVSASDWEQDRQG